MNKYEQGVVVSIANNIVIAENVGKAFFGSAVQIGPAKLPGYIVKIADNLTYISCLYSTIEAQVTTGDKVICINEDLAIKVDKDMLGRVIDPLGLPLDGKGFYTAQLSYKLYAQTTSMFQRSKVDTPLHTGIKVVDALVPIGQGQRELIVGDRQTGKTQMAIDLMINQAKAGKICVYVAINKPQNEIDKILRHLTEHKVIDKFVIVYTKTNSVSALHVCAPFSGIAICEYFRDQGIDSVITYDNLLTHAWYYRENSTLLKNPICRDSYPSNIFYIHAQLLERASNTAPSYFDPKLNISKPVSITAFPIVETQESNFSDYITTSIVSITDGQIVLSSSLFNVGIRPAVDPGNSVSRVGGAAQSALIKSLSSNIRVNLAQYRELENFISLGAEVDESMKLRLKKGKIATYLMKQKPFVRLSPADLALTLFTIYYDLFNSVAIELIFEYESYIHQNVKLEHPKIYHRLNQHDSAKLSHEEILQLKEIITTLIYNKDCEIDSSKV